MRYVTVSSAVSRTFVEQLLKARLQWHIMSIKTVWHCCHVFMQGPRYTVKFTLIRAPLKMLTVKDHCLFSHKQFR